MRNFDGWLVSVLDAISIPQSLPPLPLPTTLDTVLCGYEISCDKKGVKLHRKMEIRFPASALRPIEPILLMCRACRNY